MSELIHAESMFVDSGAHGLYNLEVLKLKKRKGATGRELAKPPVRWSQGDFSYYNLEKGSPFRKYCDSYAALIKKLSDTDVMWANVDAISNPELTWQIQRYFEEEHGVQPIPIIHYKTPLEYVDRYVNAKVGKKQKYDLLGVGGLGQGVSRHQYFSWADEFFRHICPESNKFKPLIKTHGFAMTSWELMCRYPWWSVDSATWVKLSAYGWIYLPRWSDRHGWHYDKPPLNINFSAKSPRQGEENKHYCNVTEALKDTCDRWMKHIGIGLGTVDKEGEMIEFGLTSHHRARSIANLLYLKGLEQSRPEWPHPLDPTIVQGRVVRYAKGFGL